MDTENSPGISSVSTSLPTITSTETSILDWQILGMQPLICVESRDRLLGSSNQVLVILWLSILNLVQLIIKLLQLCCLRHIFLQHELWCLQTGVASFTEEVKTVVDQGLVEEKTPVSEEITTVTNNLYTALWVVAVESGENFVVGEDISLFDSDSFRCPLSLQRVEVLRMSETEIRVCIQRKPLPHYCSEARNHEQYFQLCRPSSSR